MVAALANLLATQLNTNVLDDGNVANLQTLLQQLLTSGVSNAFRRLTAATVMALGDGTLAFNCTGGAIVQPLLATSTPGIAGKRYVIIKTDATGNALTPTLNGTDVFIPNNPPVLVTPGDSIEIQADPADGAWLLIG